jgi:hypothetical protein
MVVAVFNECKLKEQNMKELNWFQKVMIKLRLPFVSCWFRFDKNFPKLGQKVQTRITFDTKSFGYRVFVSESFEWVIDEKDKQGWLDAGISDIEWRTCN